MLPRVPQLGNSKGRFKPNHHDLKVYFFFSFMAGSWHSDRYKACNPQKSPNSKMLAQHGTNNQSRAGTRSGG